MDLNRDVEVSADLASLNSYMCLFPYPFLYIHMYIITCLGVRDQVTHDEMLHAMKHAPLTRRSDGLTESLVTDANRANPMQQLYDQLAADGEEELHWEVFVQAFEEYVKANTGVDAAAAPMSNFGLSEAQVEEQLAQVTSGRRRSSIIDEHGNRRCPRRICHGYIDIAAFACLASVCVCWAIAWFRPRA